MRGWTDEQRRAQSERMKKLREDPEYIAKQREAASKANKAKWQADREGMLAHMHYHVHCSPKCTTRAQARAKHPTWATNHQGQLAKLNSDPILIERRKAAMKEKWADPEYRARMAEAGRRAWDKRRGFRIPKDKRADYDHLVGRKHRIGAQEAGKILGLIP